MTILMTGDHADSDTIEGDTIHFYEERPGRSLKEVE